MINQVILSCNEDPIYREFWIPVSQAYKAMGFKCHLAFLTNRDEDDPLVTLYKEYGEVTLFKPLPDIPEFGQAKMIRFILASQQGEDICYLDDIDLFPLSKKFITDPVKCRPANVLLCVGAEVYGWEGCCPVSQMTTEGNIWRSLINPHNFSYSELIRSWITYFYDIREKINIEQTATDEGFLNDRYFSDERLIRRLLRETPVPIINIPRGYTDYLEATIDRATVNKVTGEWVWDRKKLANGGYVNCHGARSYSKYKSYYDVMSQYVEITYNK